MNTEESTFTASESREIEAWCAEVRAAHAIVAAPIEPGDTRYTELELTYGSHVAGFTPVELGELYFTFSRIEKPRWPLAAPAWAATMNILAGTYPEMQVQFVGKDWNAGEFSARIEQLHTVFVDDFNNHDGTVDRMGSCTRCSPMVNVAEHAEDFGWEDALQLATAIEDAATELRDFELGQ